MEYIKILKQFIKKSLKYNFFYKNYFKQFDIIIFDDIMPSSLSPWRSYEFNNLCKCFYKVKVFTDLKTFSKYNSGYSFKKSLQILKQNYFYLSRSIKRFSLMNNINSKLFYFVFYTNANTYYKIAEQNKINFVFTLYPGGGFQLNNQATENSLKKIFESKYFKGVIVNQFHVKEYLVNQKLCDENKIKIISGVPINFEIKSLEVDLKKFNGDLKILFFGNKYTKNGEDKGFDIFQEVANILINKIPNLSFHIIGNFDENDLKHELLINYFTFHGVLNEEAYMKIINKTQIIISPNRPFILSPHAFDGFPLATCVEASLFNNLIMASDYFNESAKLNLVDNVDFIKVNYNPIKISDKIILLNKNRDQIKQISISGKAKIMEIYSHKNQIKPRIELFNNILQ